MATPSDETFELPEAWVRSIEELEADDREERSSRGFWFAFGQWRVAERAEHTFVLA